jgi:hypothetical protein
MPLSAWIMTFAIGIVLYGGLGWCIAVAVRKTREERRDDDGA